MKFETNPQLILTFDEQQKLDYAMCLCRDMDCETGVASCSCCPKKNECSGLATECVFAIAHKTLKEIIDMAVIK